jgi:nitroreductase
MDALEAIAKRKSVRDYKKDQISDEAVAAIIAAGQNAPSAGPYHITVVQNKELLQHISNLALEAMKNSGNEFLMSRAALPGYDPIYGAPTLFLLSAPQGPYSLATASCAATCMIIAATALGLGSCYLITPILAFKADKGLAARAGIPEGYEIMCAVVVGYKAGEKFAVERVKENTVNYVK